MRKVQMQLGDNTQGKGVINPLTGDTRKVNSKPPKKRPKRKPSDKGFG